MVFNRLYFYDCNSEFGNCCIYAGQTPRRYSNNNNDNNNNNNNNDNNNNDNNSNDNNIYTGGDHTVSGFQYGPVENIMIYVVKM